MVAQVPPFPPVINPGDLQAVANAMLAQASLYLSRLQAVRFYAPTINPSFPTVTQPPAPLTLPPPEYIPLVWTDPAAPQPFNEQLDTSNDLPDPLTDKPPVLAFPTAPDAFNGAAPVAPPIDLNFDYPSLNMVLPTPPDLLQLETIRFDGVTLPEIDTTIPTLTAIEPKIVPYGPEQLYASTELSLLQATLKDRIQTGGTGLPAWIEKAIWDRGREREYRQMADAQAEFDRMESMGFAFPPGVWLDARIKLQTEMQNTTAGLSREIMIKQAELELQNVLHAIEQLNSLEGKLIDLWNNVQQRAFEACRYLTEAGIHLYNAQVQAYTARLDAYKTRVAIYEAQIRAALAKVDVFKAQIEFEKTKADINKLLVEEYQIKTQVALTAVEVYKAELSAIQTRAEIEKAKVQVFGEQVRAFGAEINAFTAQVEGYKARVQAEATKQDAYKALVDAYSATVGAAAKKIDAKIEGYKAKIAGKQIEYDGYKATLQALTSKAQAESQFNSTKADAYKAEVGALSAYNEALIKEWQAVLDTNMRIAEIAVQTQQANVQAYIQSASIAADATKVAAQVSAQLGAAALNAVHYSQSASWSGSISESKSESKSESTSEIKTLSV